MLLRVFAFQVLHPTELQQAFPFSAEFYVGFRKDFRNIWLTSLDASSARHHICVESEQHKRDVNAFAYLEWDSNLRPQYSSGKNASPRPANLNLAINKSIFLIHKKLCLQEATNIIKEISGN
jgi:hypothetical protein